MGGSAFNKYGLLTPRMSPETYAALRERVFAQLSTLFHSVRSPQECPGKTSYGDVDFLVQDPIVPFYTVNTIKHSLGATHAIKYGNTWSYAIPDTNEDEGNAVHRQVDVHICHANIEWEDFLDSYGDLWTILGSMTRMHGFLCDDKAFHLLVSPIDKTNKKAARLPLTKDPRECLAFLGLSMERYYQGFETVDDMFLFITSSRFYHPNAFRPDDRTHNDRSKIQKRPIYVRWLEEFLPSHQDIPTANLSREELAEEAVRAFSKEPERDAMLQKWQKVVEEKDFWLTIAKVVPKEGHELTLAMRGLKKKFADAGLEMNVEATSQWAVDNWEDASAHFLESKRTEEKNVKIAAEKDESSSSS